MLKCRLKLGNEINEKKLQSALVLRLWLLSCPPFLQCYGLQPSRLLCLWDFPDKNTGVGCLFFSRGSSQPVDQTYVSCIGRWILYA